jgi:hypothetical protein
MSKEIWLPDSKTHVIVEPDGEIRIWENIIMERKPVEEKGFGFSDKEKSK